MLERIVQYSPVATFALCSPYSSSERSCNNELTLFVRVAVVLPLPTKPRALREPYLFENTADTSCNTFHCPPVSKLTMGSGIALQIDKSIFFFKKIAHFLAYVNFLLYLCMLFRVLGFQVALLRGRMMWIFRMPTSTT